MTTKTTTEELDRIVSRARPGGNATGIQIGGRELREAANRRAANRRDRNSRSASKRLRIERQKELGNDAPMTVDEFHAAIDFVHDEFGIVLSSSWGGITLRPKITERELLALCAAVENGNTYRDRVTAVRRLSRLGFRVSFMEEGPRPSVLR